MGAAMRHPGNRWATRARELRLSIKVPAKARRSKQAAGDFAHGVLGGIEGETEQQQDDDGEATGSVDGFLGAELGPQILKAMTETCRRKCIKPRRYCGVDVAGIGDHFGRAPAVKCQLAAAEQRDVSGKAQGLPATGEWTMTLVLPARGASRHRRCRRRWRGHRAR